MTMFIESPRFPDSVSSGTSGGPEYLTNVIGGVSGYEARNAKWTYPKHKYDAAFGIREMVHLEEVLSFFHVAEGRFSAFRFKDWADFKTCGIADSVSATDMQFGIGDGSTVRFQLVKVYTVGTKTKTRLIKKPVAPVRIAVAGIEKVEGEDYIIDYTIGEVVFLDSPTNGYVLTWGGEFDVPVRFDEDFMNTSLEAYNAGAASVPIREDRPRESDRGYLMFIASFSIPMLGSVPSVVVDARKSPAVGSVAFTWTSPTVS